MVQCVPWTYCIDSKLSKLNFFNPCMLSEAFAIKKRLIVVAATLVTYIASRIRSRDQTVIVQSLNQYLQRVRPAAKTLMLVVQETTAEAGIHQLVGLYQYCSALLDQHDRTKLCLSFHGLKSLLLRKPLYLPRLTHNEERHPSLAFIFVMTMLLPEHLIREAEFSDWELRDFSFKISAAFFASTEKLLKHPKSSKKNGHSENWPILNEHLISIYFITTFPTIRKRISVRFLGQLNYVIDCLEASWDSKGFHAGLSIKSASNATVTNEEGCDHLQNYTLHWLEWLQEGSNADNRTGTKSLDLDTLCRMTGTPNSYDMKSPAEREGPLDQELEDFIHEIAFQNLEKRRDILEKVSRGKVNLSRYCAMSKNRKQLGAIVQKMIQRRCIV